MNPRKNHDARAAAGAATAPGTAVTTADRAGKLSIKHGARCYEALTWGPENGRKVIALHGWLDNAASFAVIAPALKNLRIVAVDLPGHGMSPHRASGTYHIVDYVFDVIAMADGLGWDHFDLLGHSLGAGIATLVAGAFPERVDKLALIEGLGPLSAEPAVMPAALNEAWRKSLALSGKSPPSYAKFEDAVRARSLGGSGLPDAAARLLCLRGLQERDGRWYWRNDAHLTLPSTQRLTEPQVMAFLEAITAPVLVVLANPGLSFDQEKVQARLAAVADLEVRHIAGGHHVHMEEESAEVAREVLAHLL